MHTQVDATMHTVPDCLILGSAAVAALAAQLGSPRETPGCAFGANFTVAAVEWPVCIYVQTFN
jgi:hypothetical protein